MPNEVKTRNTLKNIKTLRVDLEDERIPQKPTAGVDGTQVKSDEELRRLFMKSCMHATLKL